MIPGGHRASVSQGLGRDPVGVLCEGLEALLAAGMSERAVSLKN